MEISKILLPGGGVIASGPGARIAIQSVTHTAMVNASEELTCGSVCAACVELRLLDREGLLSLTAGDEVTLCTGETPVGRFTVEKPERRGNGWRVTGYDRVTWLDKDLSAWLSTLTGWPYEALSFARMVAGQCGLTLKNTALLNGSFPIGKITGEGITGRRLMEWLGQLCGSFCRATAAGDLEFAWYEDRFALTAAPHAFETSGSGYAVTYAGSDLCLESPSLSAQGEGDVRVTGLVAVSDDGAGNLVLAIDDGGRTGIPAAMGSVSLADYTTAPIDGVRLGQTRSDAGITYPPSASGNLYEITGNPLFTGDFRVLQEAAKGLYERLGQVTYTPGSFTTAADCGLQAGDRVRLRHRDGREGVLYLMQQECRGGSVTFRCTGSCSRQSPAAANYESFKAANLRFFTVEKSVEGLRLAAQEADTHMAQLEMDAKGLSATVSSVQQQASQNRSAVEQQLAAVQNRISGAEGDAARNAQSIEGVKTDITTLRQSAQGVSLQVQRILEQGVSRVETAMGYTFDDTGLHIQKPGQQMENTLDDTGMAVRRAGEVMLRADKDGVLATDVTVRSFLVVGEHARFENYSNGTDPNRTACFYI